MSRPELNLDGPSLKLVSGDLASEFLLPTGFKLIDFEEPSA